MCSSSARNKWRKQEPYDDIISIEYPTFISSALKYSNINVSDLISSYSSRLGLYPDTILSVLGIKDDYVDQDKTSRRLRLVK